MKFYKGMDLSTIKEVESLGGKFYDHGEEKDLFEILKSSGTNAVRLRLWNDPYAEDGTPYGAGTNDLSTVIELAKRAKSHRMEVLLCKKTAFRIHAVCIVPCACGFYGDCG